MGPSGARLILRRGDAAIEKQGWPARAGKRCREALRTMLWKERRTEGRENQGELREQHERGAKAGLSVLRTYTTHDARTRMW